MNKRPVFFLSYLAFAGLATGLYVLATGLGRPQQANQNLVSEPMASDILYGVKLNVYDAEGQLLYQLQGSSLQHLSGSELQIEAVNAKYFPLLGAPTVVQADTGNMNDEKLLLTGNVFAVKKNQQGTPTETLETSDLLVDHLGKSAKTENKAVLQQGNNVLEGVGAVVNFETGKFRLLSSVRSYREL